MKPQKKQLGRGRLRLRENPGDRLGMWVSFSLLLLLERGFGGSGYKPVMDDWFLYLGTTTYSDLWNDYIFPNDKFAIRPLAGALDCFVISPLSANPVSRGLVSVGLCLLLVAAIIILTRVLEENEISRGGLLAVLCGLYPLGFEGIYWLSAASRIIPAFFFISAAAFFATMFIKHGGVGYILMFYLTGIGAVGFYEAAIPVYFLLIAVIIWRRRKETGAKRLIIIPVIHIIMIGIYYIVHRSNVEIETRGQLITLSDAAAHFSQTAQGLAKLFTSINAQLISDAWKTGTAALSQDPTYYFFIATMSAAFGYFAAKLHVRPKNSVSSVVFGIFLAISGICVYFVLEMLRLPIRSAYMSFMGIGIAIEGIIYIITRSSKGGRAVYAVICAAAAFLCAVCGIGEVEEYRAVSEADSESAAAIIDSGLADDMIENDGYLWLFNTREYYFDDKLNYMEHIRSAENTDSAITNCLMFYTKNNGIHQIQTVADGSDAVLYVDQKAFYYAGFEDDRSLTRLELVPDGDSFILVRQTDGSVYGTLYHWQDVFNFTKTQGDES